MWGDNTPIGAGQNHEGAGGSPEGGAAPGSESLEPTPHEEYTPSYTPSGPSTRWLMVVEAQSSGQEHSVRDSSPFVAGTLEESSHDPHASLLL